MAQVIVADKAGACFGVERAIELVRSAAAHADGGVFTLGPLIHNPRVVDELEHAGVHVASSVDEAAGGTLILRTHGVKPSEQARAEEVCSEVVDATCPFVKKVHRAVERLTRDGFEVVVVGEKGHPEVDATLAHADGSQAIADADEARSAELGSRVGIVVQTTQTASNLADVVSAIDDGSREVEVVNTICEATSQRQGSAAELASHVDAMVVIGGRNSANTTHLAEICSGRCSRTYHIEDADELDPSWFEGAETIGITAGASTPASQIDAVRTALESLS